MASETTVHGGLWIRQARLRSKLSQEELARRLETSQSLVARWERGQVEPGFGTVMRAVRACGLDLAVNVVEYDHAHDLLIRENLKRSPTERLRHMQQTRASLDRLRPREGR